MNITCVAADERNHNREGDKKDDYYIRAERERREEAGEEIGAEKEKNWIEKDWMDVS